MKYGIDPSRPSKIVVLSIFDDESRGEKRILVGIRSEDTNPTHSNVVSVPTQRIPESIYDDIMNRCSAVLTKKPDCDFPERVRKTFSLSTAISDNEKEKGHNSVIFTVESLLSTKLGLADYLESGKVKFIARPRVLLEGEVFYEEKDVEIPGEKIILNGETVYREQAMMLNIEVRLKGAEFIPTQTASYRKIRWITLTDFKKLISTREASFLAPVFDGEGVHLCVHGMCLLSSDAAIETGLIR